MPIGKVHHLLCVACSVAVTTEYSYPEHICGFQVSVRTKAGVIHVCCTRDEGNEQCVRGVHYDRMTHREFETRGSLKTANDGRTSRA